MAMPAATAKISFLPTVPSSSSSSSSLTMRMRFLKPPHCAPIQQMQEQIDVGIMCEPCNGKGWLVCDFCNGQKTNVKAVNNRIYRRCPSCRAMRISVHVTCCMIREATPLLEIMDSMLKSTECRWSQIIPFSIRIELFTSEENGDYADNAIMGLPQFRISSMSWLVGYILCSNCKVFKCVTFPNYDDGEELNF